MATKKIILIFLMIVSVRLVSQNDKLRSKDSLSIKRVVINTSLFEYFPGLMLSTLNINLGAEIYLKKRKSIYVNGGYISSFGPSGSGYVGIYSLDTRGFRIQIEAKHYLGKHKVVQPAMLVFWPHIFQFHSQKLANTGFYLSTHTSFQSTQTLRPQSFVYEAYGPNKPRIQVENNYKVIRRAAALHLKIGYHCIKSSGFSIDYAVGLGAQMIYSESVGKSPLGEVWSESQTEYGQKLFDSGFALAPSFVYQVKIGLSK